MTTRSVEVSSYVGGQWVGGEMTSLDRNPARPQEIIAEVHLSNDQIAREAIESAHAAYPGWRDTPGPARGEILRRAADLLEDRTQQIGEDFAREEGKALGEAIGEVKRAISILRYYAGQTMDADGETYPSQNGLTLLFARREPLGVVVAITPFNFPFAIPAWKIAPALAYGNTVVWKPAEVVPLTSAHLLNAFVDAGLPQGVLNMVIGRGRDVGTVLASHPMVEALSFTGSAGVGKVVQGTAIEHGKKVQLELGGKNPAIVLADADMEQAVEQVARGAFLSAGQKCTATSRVIVEQSVLREFTERLSHLAATWKVGDPLDAETRVGPLVSEDQLTNVMGYIDLARADGATVVVGGHRPEDLGDGYFVAPTVLEGLSPESRVVREEIFGPVAAILPADSYEDAVRLANDTPFGLAASLFTRDLGKALRFVREIRSGVVKVNQESAGLELHVPFGGMKRSSSGSREQGKVARDFYTQWKTVYIDAPSR
jgi:alpha-ketoglutaric semialdehyde dehydrogenase